jgi:hypothetical protein
VDELIAAFTSAIADPRFLIAVGFAALAGMVRGFTGFGSALIYMPLISALYGPKVAAATLLLIDTVCALPVSIRLIPHCNWREVGPVTIGGFIALPLGVIALLHVDPLILRWCIAVLVLVALGTLVAGWRYHGRPTFFISLAVGAVSGFCGGALQIGAPPLLIFWLGGKNSAATVRANIMVYFIMQGALSCALYLYGGLITTDVIVLSLLMGPPFAIALVAGASWFHGTSDALYRRVAYLIIAFAGIAGLPLFDALR